MLLKLCGQKKPAAGSPLPAAGSSAPPSSPEAAEKRSWLPRAELAGQAAMPNRLESRLPNADDPTPLSHGEGELTASAARPSLFGNY